MALNQINEFFTNIGFSQAIPLTTDGQVTTLWPEIVDLHQTRSSWSLQ